MTLKEYGVIRYEIMQRLYDENPFHKDDEVATKIWLDKVQVESAGLWEQIDEEERAALEFNWPLNKD